VKGVEDCIFCKIVRRELPSYLIFEDENFIAFLDIRPLNPGHTLVSPKKHHKWVWDVPEAGRYFETVRTIAKTLQKTMNTEWIVADIGGMGVPTRARPRDPEISKRWSRRIRERPERQKHPARRNEENC